MTDWALNGSVKKSNQGQLNVADADPQACNSVDPTPMGTSFSVNPEEVYINNAYFDEIPRGPMPLLQQ